MYLRAAPNAEPAQWLVAGLHGFGECVLSLVPAGFPRYLRVFHPAERLTTAAGSRRAEQVRWAEIAAANGKRVHAGMQLAALTGSDGSVEQGQAGVFDHPPDICSLPQEQAAALAPVLARHTRTPELCWFAVWEGFGDLPENIRRAPTFEAPHRQYHLLMGPVAAIAEGVDAFAQPQSPNLCWPGDRAWCFASEIDLNTTYLGCGDACAEEILALPVEALAIDPATGIDFASDVLNAVE